MDDADEGQPGLARRTLAKEACVEGLGLFTGVRTRVLMRPGVPGEGITFRRVDLPGSPAIPATVESVLSEQRRTVLRKLNASNGARVETVEHILSALAGLGIDDALIDVEGPEIPIGDGSALPFAEAIRAAGVGEKAGSAPEPLRITRALTVGEKGAQIDVLPVEREGKGLEGCEYVYRLDYGPGSPIPPQEATFFMPVHADGRAYIEHLAPARTFSTLAEAQAMRQMGLFTQFSPRDLLVIGPEGPVDNTLRFPDEPARHKVLDMVGDLSLAGRRLVGRVIATRSGHALNHEVARALASLA